MLNHTKLTLAILFGIFAAVGGMAGCGSCGCPDLETPQLQAESLSRVKKVALATLLYLQDYDTVYPTMPDAGTTRNLLFPYIKSNAVFIDPISNAPFVFNAWFSGKDQNKLPNEAFTFAMIYDPDLKVSGKWPVAFPDGHGVLLLQSEWLVLKSKSHIP